MHTYLAEGPACAYHRELGWDLCPMLHILDGACPELARTMPGLVRDPHRPEDVDTDGPDHWYDAARYLELSIGGGPQFLTLPDAPDTGGQIQPLKPLGKFARKLSDVEQQAEWAEDDDGPARGATQLSPFA
jgi:hypothetical protein